MGISQFMSLVYIILFQIGIPVFLSLVTLLGYKKLKENKEIFMSEGWAVYKIRGYIIFIVGSVGAWVLIGAAYAGVSRSLLNEQELTIIKKNYLDLMTGKEIIISEGGLQKVSNTFITYMSGIVNALILGFIISVISYNLYSIFMVMVLPDNEKTKKINHKNLELPQFIIELSRGGLLVILLMFLGIYSSKIMTSLTISGILGVATDSPDYTSNVFLQGFGLDGIAALIQGGRTLIEGNVGKPE